MNREITYNKLWKLLIDNNMKKIQLKDIAGISSSTLAKLSKNKPVTMEVLLKISEALDCDIKDIVEFKRVG